MSATQSWWPFIRGSFIATRHGIALRVKHHLASVYRKAFAERVGWSRDQFDEFQHAELDMIIRHAVEHVPWYRERSDKYLRKGSPRPLAELPIIEKIKVQEETSAFYAVDGIGRVRQHTTSGTTGSPLIIRCSHRTHALFQAGLERFREAYGFRECQRLAVLSGFFRPSNESGGDQLWWRDYIGNRMFLSLYHYKDILAQRYQQLLHDFRPVALFGYASSVYQLAALLKRNNLSGPDSIKVVLTTSEVLYPDWRDCIQNTINAPVADQYGSQEAQCLITQCRAGRMHINPEHGIVEVVDDQDRPAEPGQEGQLLLTGLVNDAMPLMRYRIGDRAAIDPFSGSCECGLAWPAISSIGGRSEDAVWTPDGRPIMYLNFHSTKNIPAIIESQFIQDAPDHLRVLLVVARTLGPQEQKMIEAEIRQRAMYDFRLTIEYLEQIPRGPRGKFKAVVNQLKCFGHNESKSQ